MTFPRNRIPAIVEALQRRGLLRLRYKLLLAGAVAGLGFLLMRGGNGEFEDQFITISASRGDIVHTVSSTGVLQAVVTVQIGSQVSGRIRQLHADFNSLVREGQVLAVIDPSTFEAQLARSRAALAMAKANVKNAEAALGNRKAEWVSAQANWEAARVVRKDANQALRRMRGLQEAELTSERQLEEAQAAFDQASARSAQAAAQAQQIEAAIQSAEAQLEQAHASVKQTQAELRVAEVNLKYTKIIAPIDGVVIERNVDIGQTVAASFQAPVLFLIANDLTRMQVIAQVDEADIGALSEEAEVEFTVDAFPRETFRGRISEIRLSSTLPNSGSSSTATTTSGNPSNVVTYNVVLDVNNDDLKLRPAMTANVTFTVARAEGMLKIPNSALRYRPSGQAPGQGKMLFASSLPPGSASDENARKNKKFSGKMRKKAVGQRGERGAGRRNKLGHPPDQQPVSEEGHGEAETPARMLAATTQVNSPSQYAAEHYGIRPGVKISFPKSSASFTPRPGMVWVVDGEGNPQPRRIALGITNGRETAVLRGELEPGDSIITGEYLDEEEMGTRSPFGGPFGNRRPRRRRRSR